MEFTREFIQDKINLYDDNRIDSNIHGNNLRKMYYMGRRDAWIDIMKELYPDFDPM